MVDLQDSFEHCEHEVSAVVQSTELDIISPKHTSEDDEELVFEKAPTMELGGDLDELLGYFKPDDCDNSPDGVQAMGLTVRDQDSSLVKPTRLEQRFGVGCANPPT